MGVKIQKLEMQKKFANSAKFIFLAGQKNEKPLKTLEVI